MSAVWVSWVHTSTHTHVVLLHTCYIFDLEWTFSPFPFLHTVAYTVPCSNQLSSFENPLSSLSLRTKENTIKTKRLFGISSLKIRKSPIFLDRRWGPLSWCVFVCESLNACYHIYMPTLIHFESCDPNMVCTFWIIAFISLVEWALIFSPKRFGRQSFGVS